MAAIVANKMPYKTLRDGSRLPMLGLGTYLSGEQATSWALEAGYRLIDTASLYQ